MNHKVLCLCRSFNVEDGLVFPYEEEECYFPGFFVIEEQKTGKLGNKYLFEAIATDKKVKVPLQKYKDDLQKPIFLALSRFGDFFFIARRLKEHYVGNLHCLQHHHPFWSLEELHPRRLEDVCKRTGFFFVGAVENDRTDSDCPSRIIVDRRD